MSTFVNLSNGFLQLFTVYGALNLGFIYLYRTTGVMNFAQGQVFVFAGLTLYWFVNAWGLAVGLVATAGVLAVVGYFVFMAILRTLRGGSPLIQVLGTFMLGVGLMQVSGALYGPAIREFSLPRGRSFDIAGGQIVSGSLIYGGSVILIAVLLDLLINRTVFGARMRAAAEDGELADYVGVKRNRLWAVSWVVVFVTSGAAAFVYAGRAPLALSISSVGFSAFPAAIIGGMDSLRGMVVGAALVALIQTAAAYYLNGIIADMLTYVLMLGVLLVRPTGILGRRSVSRI